ncbi:hypothetical protein R1flu_029133 [Riccia fluitans]|uniref:Secreted protein n=1 Tax=Riccia fluitans TaxID=41844 RepID=A0ABD1XNR1_9MARC
MNYFPTFVAKLILSSSVGFVAAVRLERGPVALSAIDVSIAFDQAVLSSVVLLDHSCSKCEFVPNTIVSFARWLFTTITSSFILLQELPHQLLMASSRGGR